MRFYFFRHFNEKSLKILSFGMIGACVSVETVSFGKKSQGAYRICKVHIKTSINNLGIQRLARY